MIEIVVSPEGQSRVETRGFVGSSCREASQFLESALGRRVGEKLTAEFQASVHQWLVNSNWLRTVAWSARGLVAFWIVWEFARSTGPSVVADI